ncbi:hypothetical protein OK016_20080 [Vibrio chagasii]|nr:hypothetical protein [Vibrio chagasii]
MNIDVDSGTLLPARISDQRGISQVGFINNEWTGLIVLSAIAPQRQIRSLDRVGCSHQHSDLAT